MQRHVVVADLGLGNVSSVANMLRRLGCEPLVATRADVAPDARRIVIPGVGSFDAGMRGLRSSGWADVLRTPSREQRVIGICLGMQLLAEGSEEGDEPGLGLIPARFVRFDATSVTVPHMGWNEIDVIRPSTLIPESNERQRYYFTHSYRAVCRDETAILATAEHGGAFVAAYGIGNIFGVQFHPEKSHRFGMALLRRFMSV